MGYSYWPDDGRFSFYNWWDEWRKALTETSELVALGTSYFPGRIVTPYWEGVVSSCTATTLVDADSETDWTVTSPCTGSRFANYECPDADHLPQFYDLILSADPNDQRKFFRTPISANSTNELTFSDITIHRDVYKQISGFSELNGKKYWIVPRGGGSGVSQWWHDRWLIPPSGAIDRGSSTAVDENEITDDTKDWTSHPPSGDIIFSVTGALVRRSISGHTKTTITIGGSTVTPDGGSYYIVPSGGVFVPRDPSPPLRWYGGATESYVGIGPGGSTMSVRHPRYNVPWLQGPVECEEVDHDAKDHDLFSEFDEQCSTPDRSYAPDYWRAPIRASQCWLEAVSGNFVEDKDYDDELGILPLEPAYNFYLKSINSASSSATVSSGSVTFSVSVPSPYTSIDLYFVLYDHRLRVVTNGTLTTSGSITFNDINENLEGRSLTLVTSRSWTRKTERRIRYIYSREWLVAPRDDEGGVITTPEDTPDGTGVWVVEEPDTHNMEYDDDGFPVAGLEAVANGQSARYVGHNWDDAVIAGSSYQNEPDDIDYIIHAEFLLPADRAAYDDSKRAVAVSGSAYHVTTNANWWTAGSLRTESGTATGGSTTSLSDSSKSASNYWNPASGRWTTFIIEVEVEPDVWEPRPITGHSGTTLSWSQPLSASASGKNYRIVEPEPESKKNRWKGRKVTINHDGTSVTRTISHSNDDTLFWTTALDFDVEAGDAITIDEIEPGEVVSRSSGEWQRATNSRKVVADVITRYGRARKGDFIWQGLFQELFDYRNNLTARRFDALQWHANGESNWWDYGLDLGFPALYFREPSGDQLSYDQAWQLNVDYANNTWETFGAAAGPADDVSPRTWSSGYSGGIYLDDQGETMIEGGNNYFAYPRATGLPTWKDSVATFYCMAGVGPSTDDPSETTRDGESGYSYDDNGTEFPFLRWSNLGNVGGDDETRELGTRIGTPDIAEIPAFEQPDDALITPHGSYVAYNRWVGYIVLDECVVCSFKGSMTYVDPDE